MDFLPDPISVECERDIDRALAWLRPISLDERIRAPKVVLPIAMDIVNKQLADRWPREIGPYRPPRCRRTEQIRWRFERLLQRLGYLNPDGTAPI